MGKEFKNIMVGYEPICEVRLDGKSYTISHVVDKEDIYVNFNGKEPYLKKIIKPSEERIYDGCPFFKECGGCDFQHIRYSYEVALKKKYLNDLFAFLSLRNPIEILSMYEDLHYRNKCQMVYKLSKSKKVVTGLYEEKTHKIVPVTECLLHPTKVNQIITAINHILSKNKILPYDERTRLGVLRHIFIRYGFNTKQVMLVLVTNGEMFPGRNNVVKDILKLDLGIDTIVQNFNSRDTSIVLGDRERTLYGPGFIYETIGEYKFKISSQSFFQINTMGMKKLYDLALSKAKLQPMDTVIDAYCGVGTISIFASKYVKKVIGVELNKQAVADAKINAKINHIANINFVVADATDFMIQLSENRTNIDVVILDPPREGSTKQCINAIGKLKPRRVIYISCEPKTLKRDLYFFFDNGYKVEYMEAVDMFPRTIHIETVVTLSLRK